MILASAGALAIVVAAPLAIVARMGVDSNLPGMEVAKSFLSMIADRSPGDRTTAELTKTKRIAALPAPKQRALPKVVKPELPKEFVEAIAPPPPKVEQLAAIAPLASIGPTLITPSVPGGGGVIIPPQSPPGGGGGPPPETPENPPPENPPPENPPPENPPPEHPPPPAVPEPGTWATMLLGFGLTGWMIRRRRRTATALNPA